MKIPGASLFGYGLALGLVCCRPAAPDNQEPGQFSRREETEAITAVSDARAEAFRQGNASGIALHFTEDAVLMAPDQPALRGREAVEAYYQAIFDTYLPDLSSSYEEVEVSGDLAFGRGFAEVVLVPKQGGDTLRSTAKYLNILKKQADGTWKTTHDIWNNNE
jgi:uncharacterized protein (TIGR02246 family)